MSICYIQNVQKWLLMITWLQTTWLNSNHESQVEIIYKRKRNKISWFSTYLSYACEIQTGDLPHFFMEVEPADWNFFQAIFCNLAIKGRGSRFSAFSFFKMLFCCRGILYRVCKQYDHVVMNQSAHSPGSHLHLIDLNICK